ncbi:MAG: rRNA maturation RNase YbeY [Rhodobacteraceae bacterium]|nr:rRNA maturation RNase YbeY [Paracoccaceae bacterium]
MTQLTDVMIEDPRWDALDLDVISERAALAALKICGLAPDGFEISVMGCDDQRIADLNAEFRGKPTPTNVLSWPAFELAAHEAGSPPTHPNADFPPESIGDIAIAFETCQREAAEKSININDHVTHLVLHGCLHLLGYDHENDADATLMEGLEIKALATLGIPNPY